MPCNTLVEEVNRSSGQVDILVNNAGGVLGQVGRPLETVTPEQWNAIFAVNVSGAFYLCQAVAPGMKAARCGRIINICERRRTHDQPDRYPGVCCRESRPDQPDAPTRT